MRKASTHFRPGQGAYKFLNSRFLDAFIRAGTVKIGTLAEYRIDDGKAAGRSDPEEGFRVFDAPGVHNLADNPGLLEMLGISKHPAAAYTSLHLEDGAALNFHSDAYVFCASRKLTKLLVQKMARLFDCDACVRISDLVKFGNAVTSRAPQLQESDRPDVPAGTSAYANVEYNLPEKGAEGYLSSRGAQKNKRFRWQKEVRIIWPGVQPLKPFVLDVPEVVPFLTQVDLHSI